MTMKQVEVKILQQSYLLACKEGQEERLVDAVELVDSAMTRIHDAGKVRARERIAVLAALNLAYELGDLRQALAAQTKLQAEALTQLAPEPGQATEQEAAEQHPASVAPAHGDAALAQHLHEQTAALQSLVDQLDAVLAELPPAATAQPQADHHDESEGA